MMTRLVLWPQVEAVSVPRNSDLWGMLTLSTLKGTSNMMTNQQTTQIVQALNACTSALQEHERRITELENKWGQAMLKAHAKRVADTLERELQGVGLIHPQDPANKWLWLLDVARQLSAGLHIDGRDVAYFLREFPMRGQA